MKPFLTTNSPTSVKAFRHGGICCAPASSASSQRSARAPPPGARVPRQPLRAPLQLVAEPPHGLGALTDVRIGQLGAHRRGNRKEPRAQLAVARIALAGKAYQLRS